MLLGLAALPGGCVPSPEVPGQVVPPPDPFVRLPYLQAVAEDSAVVRWRSGSPGGDRLRFRRGDGAWRSARVVETGGGDRQAVLDSLPPSAQVTYAVRSGGVEVGPFGFRSPPADTAGGGFRVLAFGDSGWGGDAQTDLAHVMEGRRWDLALHVGDLAYPDGTEADFTLRHFDVYGDLFATVPFYPVPGNHDVHTEGGAAYDRAFAWPDGEGGRWYALRWGSALFVGLDTSGGAERDSLEERTGAQHAWLSATLEEAARDTTLDWTVVFSHYPLYSHASGIAGHGPEEELREALEPLFVERGVDLVLAGHDHHYERSFPIRDGHPVDPGCGPVYMVIGGGGAQRFARSVSPDAHTARVDRSYHVLSLQVGRRAVAGEALGRDGRVFDRFRIQPTPPADDLDGCG